ncbi:hypothetical protein U6B65_00950 [Oscillospiraceae bacterium MB08-C2-2]|nr:hypothetical protein U6B65_00950 [Oscillospiraceae bacterium MB08-C2-2]
MEELMSTPIGESSQSNTFKEAVCVEVNKIFDSCSDKDCLEDLQMYFTAEDQAVIDRSNLIKCRSAEVMDVYINVESIPFNRGFYAVDLTFFFRVNFSAQTSPISNSVNVRGLAVYTKRVILFGSEGGVKSFCSGAQRIPYSEGFGSNMPIACVKTVAPITLGSRVCEYAPAYCDGLGSIPADIAAAFDGPIITQPGEDHKVVLVTLGVFTIVTLERSVQLLIPAYDYSVPEKDCTPSISTDDPCEIFRKVKFPVEEFFPESLNGSCDCRS